MKPGFILCLLLVLSGGAFGCSSAAHRGVTTAPSEKATDENAWHITLRAAVTNGDVLPPAFAGGRYFIRVPVEAATILERQPPEESLPFLIKLRKEPPAWKGAICDEWILIVRDGLRGTPEVVTNTLKSAKGNVISTTLKRYYAYSVPATTTTTSAHQTNKKVF